MHFSELKTLYTGSVKSLYEAPKDKDSLYFQFTDDYSVFDWGKMPDTIDNKGRVLCLMGGVLMHRATQAETWKKLKDTSMPFQTTLFESETYKQLCQNGFNTHFKTFTDETLKPLSEAEALQHNGTVLMQVDRASVTTVSRHLFNNQLLYEYPPTDTTATRRFIPLEVVFRMGLPEGSSMLGRFQKQPELLKQYGFTEQPKAWSWFKTPVVEFFTKLEAEDRKISEQEALVLSGLPFEQFQTMYEGAQLLALWLYAQYQELGLSLWDGKFEFSWDQQKGLVLVDTIGLDEIRVTQDKTVLSKEFLRQFYRTTEWATVVKKCQEETPEIFALQKDTLPQPPKLPTELKQTAQQLYETVLNVMMAPEQSQRQEYLTALASKLSEAEQLIRTQKTAGVR